MEEEERRRQEEEEREEWFTSLSNREIEVARVLTRMDVVQPAREIIVHYCFAISTPFTKAFDESVSKPQTKTDDWDD